jgi:2'-5' RNA ligase
MRLDLHALGTFPGSEGVLFLATTVDAELLAQHRRVSEVLAGGWVEPWQHYLPGRWVPHCTLTQRLDHDQVVNALRAVLDYHPISADVASIGITDTTTGEVELILAR